MLLNRRMVLAAALCILLSAAPAGCGEARPAKKAPRAASDRFFSPRSFWNRALPAHTQLARDSAGLVSRLRQQLASSNAWINTWEFSTPIYRVGRHQRRIRVALDRPYGSLAKGFKSVPLPANAKPANGSDRHLVVWQPSTDTMWEFFKLRRRKGSWHAAWGGRMRHVSRSKGVFADPMGATATGLPLMGGLIRASELRRGRIDHALAISIPHTRARAFVPPAMRTDGDRYDPAAIPEGTRFRLDPSLDLSKMQLPRVTRIIARAAQRYGVIVRDKGGAVTFYAEAPKHGHPNPYRRLFGGRSPTDLLSPFPWSRLQVVNARVIRRWRAGSS
jgi:hypothetical protein